MIDSIHNQGLRLSTGAFRTYQIASLTVDAGEFSLQNRRSLQTIKYAIKLKENPNFCHIFLQNPPSNYSHNATLPKPFIARLGIEISKLNYVIPKIVQFHKWLTPPWTEFIPKIILDIAKY